MHQLSDRASIEQWSSQGQRTLLLKTLDRITQGETYDSSVHGFFLIVEAGEGLEDISRALGRDVDQDSWEYVDEHADCYEMVCVLADSGWGVVVIVPKNSKVDSGLLEVCTQQAYP